jgi:(1->4)-alpha-D-glucan 1-alpha-D-glucosylmutase
MPLRPRPLEPSTAPPRRTGATVPTATYRLQLHAGFDFRGAAALTEHLAALGISHCYASPILQARHGSLHGYDGVDPTRISTELGGDAGFADWDAALRSAGLGLLLDIVPNHLCVVGGENPWWEDVLTHGRGSPHAFLFDIDWKPPDPALRGRVLLPLLGRPPEEALAAGELRVEVERGALRLACHEHRWPLAPRSWLALLAPLARQRGLPPAARAGLRETLQALRGFPAPPRTARPLSARRLAAFAAAREALAGLLEAHSALAEALAAALDAFNGAPGGPGWAALLAGQAWVLEDWRAAGTRLNYRRFFDIAELAGLRQQDPRVFRATHARVLALVEQGAVQGLRIDHPDGLADPTGYLRRLRRALHASLARATGPSAREALRQGPSGYVVVEKILDPGERRRGDWPVEGGTGYDMLYRLNAVQVDAAHAAAFRAAYARCTGDAEAFAEHVREGKRLVLRTALAGELERLVGRVQSLARHAGAWAELEAAQWRRALEALAVSLPVYRTYVAGGRPASGEDAHWIAVAVAETRHHHGELEPALLDWLGALLQAPAQAVPRARLDAQGFVTRFQQLTSAAMAKGVEDTAFYRYVPLISLNEVGGDPGTFGIGRAAFHTWNRQRARRWPHALSATATHDTKRGEGVRARLNALSEQPAEWEAAVVRWQALNARHRTRLPGLPGGGEAPSPTAEYLLYQTLVGAWPLGGRADPEWDGFAGRIEAFVTKALREAKRETSWLAPDDAYEEAVRRFVRAVLADEPANAFPAALEAFLPPLQRAGLYNALSQTLLKIALPGVPDFYQGTELWDHSLVDPDNRRPVDFARRRELLAGLPASPTPEFAQRLLAAPADGRIKLLVIREGLALRNRRRALFAGSDYRPLTPEGAVERHALAFARTRGRAAVVAAVGRFYLGLPGGREEPPTLPVGAGVWGETVLTGERGLPGGTYRDALTGRELAPRREGGRVVFPLREVFAHLPLALLERLP